MSDKEQLSFEEALAKLEAIVEELDDESIPLERSIELYEKGIKLSKLCTKTLEEAELRIEQVTKQHAFKKDNN